ncbi:hypothetical protein [Erwinia phyllosphaerae]|uniref:hypothetical protein n=1 Tax=Erwinia phyllosphaerae TaxID=2853256 RepID=UPI001FEDE446|nr:hypothetical protein [Erwinia phyllosphaerae]MBV4365548.1 hypothetical protein [Erwinia phyllosphaerae]
MEKKEKAPDTVSSALRVLKMCCELHRLGFRQLQIYPAMSPSGAHWRLTLAPACCFTRWNSSPQEHDQLFAHYSGGNNPLMLWPLNGELTSSQLAEKFIQTFPELIKRCKGKHEAYSFWLAELIDFCINQQSLPYFQADWQYDFNQGVPLINGQTFRLLPETERSRWQQWINRIWRR